MKRTLIASFIVVACVLVSVISLIYIESTCADMIETTDKAIASIMTQDLHQLRESLSESIKMLEKSRPALNLILGQDDTVELRGNLNKAIFYCNCKDYSTAILHLQEYKTSLNRIISTNEPTPSTIF